MIKIFNQVVTSKKLTEIDPKQYYKFKLLKLNQMSKRLNELKSIQ